MSIPLDALKVCIVKEAEESYTAAGNLAEALTPHIEPSNKNTMDLGVVQMHLEEIRHLAHRIIERLKTEKEKE